ncbi:GCN5-related N-acetyltransferase [Calothrix sp. NIES-4071]|nr:GCN5-related N-acetyltransferase [Calothrix sp. NIES-4071]BAZ60677.1 GCN5-related N-acetyltransferase [Calothrix sp. NIES-4105]
MSQKCTIIYEESPENAFTEVIQQGINKFNQLKAGNYNYKKLCLSLRDSEQKIVGGLVGETYWECFYIELFWINESYRKEGYGSIILQMAEDEARSRGVKQVYLNTFTFQAPDFYQNLGYRVFGELPNFPPGHKCYFLSKNL